MGSKEGKLMRSCLTAQQMSACDERGWDMLLLPAAKER